MQAADVIDAGLSTSVCSSTDIYKHFCLMQMSVLTDLLVSQHCEAGRPETWY